MHEKNASGRVTGGDGGDGGGGGGGVAAETGDVTAMGPMSVVPAPINACPAYALNVLTLMQPPFCEGKQNPKCTTHCSLHIPIGLVVIAMHHMSRRP